MGNSYIFAKKELTFWLVWLNFLALYYFILDTLLRRMFYG